MLFVSPFPPFRFADGFGSWTVITWIVVVGSTVVMMLWILIYSFFMSIDFVDEVLILFGGIQFWATVLFTTTVALGAFIHIHFISLF